uniref:RNA helicase n=1 Tax=Hirondellea gigas TaxID=1518452 RepID=A0A6A7FU93_9CRUS
MGSDWGDWGEDDGNDNDDAPNKSNAPADSWGANNDDQDRGGFSSTKPVQNGFGGGGWDGAQQQNDDGMGGPMMDFDNLGRDMGEVDWKTEKLNERKRDYYKTSESVSRLSASEVAEIRKSMDITVVGKNIPNIILSFKEANFPSFINDQIKRDGFEKPTPIQAQGWPMVLTGRDVVGIADTGSGKTLAFLAPGMVHIKAQPPLRRGDGPIVVVLSPTRELAKQTQTQAYKYGSGGGIRSVCCYGGAPRRPQAMALQSGAEIVVGTPGRVLDFLSDRTTNFKNTTYLVLDEADRMLEMGFERQIRRIMSQVRPDRQILLFSATWPREVVGLARDYLKDPLQVNIGSLETSAVHSVEQIVEVVDDRDKKTVLIDTILPKVLDGKRGKVLIFCARKVTTDFVATQLRSRGLKAMPIHGDKQQFQRDHVLNSFRSGVCQIMVATDVASRGLDVPDITCVVNFDFPNQIEDYVHRIGRTGRAGRKGVAYSLLTPEDASRAQNLIRILQEANQKVPDALRQLSNGGYFEPERRYGKPWKERDQFERDEFNARSNGASNSYSGRGGGGGGGFGGGRNSNRPASNNDWRNENSNQNRSSNNDSGGGGSWGASKWGNNDSKPRAKSPDRWKSDKFGESSDRGKSPERRRRKSPDRRDRSRDRHRDRSRDRRRDRSSDRNRDGDRRRRDRSPDDRRRGRSPDRRRSYSPDRRRGRSRDHSRDRGRGRDRNRDDDRDRDRRRDDRSSDRRRDRRSYSPRNDRRNRGQNEVDKLRDQIAQLTLLSEKRDIEDSARHNPNSYSNNRYSSYPSSAYPTSSSLMNGQPTSKDWTCNLCTLVNSSSFENCDACRAPRPTGLGQSSSSAYGSQSSYPPRPQYSAYQVNPPQNPSRYYDSQPQYSNNQQWR